MCDNEYNRGVRNKLSQLNRKVIEHENQISHSNEGEHKITTRLEGMCLRKKNVHGGSGYAAATVMDQGFERTEGAGVSAAGVSAAGVSGAGGVRPIGSGSRTRKKKDWGRHNRYYRRRDTYSCAISPTASGCGQEAKGKKNSGWRDWR